MLLPKALKKGDTIGVFSPSYPATLTAKRRYLRAKTYLEQKGYRILEGELTGEADHYRSGTILQRAQELNALIRNPDVRCIMSAIGGWNSNSLLPYIDYDALKENPKIVVGYSDVTAILLAVYEKTGMPTFYGPAMVASLGEFPPFVDWTWGYFEDIAATPKIPHTFQKPTRWTEEFIDWDTQQAPKKGVKNAWVTVCGGEARGRLVGGNLNTLAGVWGSEYMPQIQKGDILFIEDSLKDAQVVERSFSHLKLNGVFDKIGGLILGKHEGFDHCGTNRKPHEILREVMGEINIPVLAEFDCCHTHPMFTLPIGCKIALDAGEQTVTLLEQAVV